MEGVHDMGGRTELFGPLKPLDRDEPVFAQPWEGRAFACTLLANRAATSSNLHAFRHALERVPEQEYLADYYGRWLASAEILLRTAGCSPKARSRRAHTGCAVRTSRSRPTRSRTSRRCRDGGSGQPADRRRAPGVRGGRPGAGRSDRPPGHTRLTGYVCGKTGTVTALAPAQVLPDTAAHFRGENPQHVYSVAFDSAELWGPDAEPFSLTVDLFESYLEKA